MAAPGTPRGLGDSGLEEASAAKGGIGVYVASPEHPLDQYFDIVCNERSLGVNISGIEITSMTKDGWASRNGILVDDEVRKVNGVELGLCSKEEKMALFRVPRPITLSIKRPYMKDSYYSVTLDDRSLGLGFRGVVVTKVKPGMWAENVGIKESDQIVEVDGVDFAPLSEAAKIELFKRPRPIVMRMKRPCEWKQTQREQVKAARQRASEESTRLTMQMADRPPPTIKPPEPKGMFASFKAFCCGTPVAEDDIRVSGRREQTGFR